MKTIRTPVSLNELWINREVDFEELVKIVIDVQKGILAADAEMHADLEKELLDAGSRPQDLWGANIYPTREYANRLEFTSFIKIRPGQGNNSMEVINIDIQNRISEIVNRLIT